MATFAEIKTRVFSWLNNRLLPESATTGQVVVKQGDGTWIGKLIAGGDSYIAATGTNDYSVSVPEIDSLSEGLSMKVKIPNTNTGACTLNLNSFGAKNLYKYVNKALASGDLPANKIIIVTYTGSAWQIIGMDVNIPTTASGEQALSVTSTGVKNNYEIVTAVAANLTDLQNASWTNDKCTGVTGYQGQVASDSNYAYICTSDAGAWTRFRIGFPTVNTGEKAITITSAGIQKTYDVVATTAANLTDLQSATWTENKCTGVTGYASQFASDSNWIYFCYDDAGKWIRIPIFISDAIEQRLGDIDDSGGVKTSGDLDTAYPTSKIGQQVKGNSGRLYQKEGAGSWIYFSITNC